MPASDGVAQDARYSDKRSAFSVTGLLVLCVVCVTHTPSFGHASAYFGRTNDTTPVAMTMKDSNGVIRFVIPKNFLTFSENWNGGVQSGIRIEVRFPAMQPFNRPRQGDKIEREALVISLDSFIASGWKYDVSKVLAGRIKDQWTLVSTFTDNKGRSYKQYVGYQDRERRKDPAVLVKEFFVPEGEDIYLECFREQANPNVGCSGNINYGQNLSLTFIFRRVDFEEWPQLRMASIRLLDSFRQDGIGR